MQPLAAAQVNPPFHRYRLVAVAALAAFVAQQVLLWWLYYHGGGKQLVGDEVRYLQVAHDIRAGGPWHPSDIWPPGQPLFIALLEVLGGDAVWPVQVAQTLLFLGCGLLLWRLWRRLSGNAGAAAIATALFLLNPSVAAYAQYLWPEVPHLFLLLLALDLLLARPPRMRTALAAGIAIGLALLFKSLLTGFWPLLLLCFVTRWRPLHVHWRAAGSFVIAIGIVTAPAIVAGHRNSGHWSIADSSAINLLIGLEPYARNDYIPAPRPDLVGDYQRSGNTREERDAWLRGELQKTWDTHSLSQLLWKQLSRQYFRLFESKTLLLTQLPGPACGGYLSAYAATPTPILLLTRWSSHLFHALMLAGFAFGVFLRRERTLATWLLLAYLAYQLTLFFGLLTIARYLLQMVPLLCGFAGDALAFAVTRHSDEPQPRWRLLAGAALAGLLLWFAFAAPWLDRYCRA